MTGSLHRILEKDLQAKRGVCACCGPVDLFVGVKPDGKTPRWHCASAGRARMRAYTRAHPEKGREWRRGNPAARRPHLAFRGGCCERCGHVPLFLDVLAVHHVDQNHENNDPANLKTLCSSCHIETHALLRAQEEAA
jgi:5-methylcytosine-specific restriction endonuclease McrA